MITFYYGTMNCGKSTRLITQAYNCKECGSNVLVYKPECDTRENNISSRTGLSLEAKTFNRKEIFNEVFDAEADVIFIDESQFLSREDINTLVDLNLKYKDLEINCYGLKNNFQSELFEGSKRLLEVSSQLVNLGGRCKFCGAPASQNLRINNNSPVFNGNEIQIGGNESYIPLCEKCYFQLMKNAEGKIC